MMKREGKSLAVERVIGEVGPRMLCWVLAN